VGPRCAVFDIRQLLSCADFLVAALLVALQKDWLLVTQTRIDKRLGTILITHSIGGEGLDKGRILTTGDKKTA
jgi:hypothetical protein